MTDQIDLEYELAHKVEEQLASLLNDDNINMNVRIELAAHIIGICCGMLTCLYGHSFMASLCENLAFKARQSLS